MTERGVGRNRARLTVVAAALLFSTGGAAVKAATLTSWQVASLRCGVAALVLPFLLPAARGRWSWRSVPVALAYAGTLTCFVVATKWTTAANAIFLQSTAPLYVLCLAPWLLRERIRARDLVFMALLGLGLTLFFFGVLFIMGAGWGLTSPLSKIASTRARAIVKPMPLPPP